MVAADPTPAGASVETAGDEVKLPFRVCTLTEVAQRGYIRDDDVVEWVWTRAHEFCQIKREPGRLLMLNKDALARECRVLQVDPAQIHYRGKDGGDQAQWKEHTMESKAYLVALMWALKNRAMQPQSKLLAMKLLLALVTMALASADLSVPMTAMLQTRRDLLAARVDMSHIKVASCSRIMPFQREAAEPSLVENKTWKCEKGM